MIEYIIFKLRKENLSAFLNLYTEMRNQDPGFSGFISLEGLNKSLKKLSIDIQEESVEKIWIFF